MVTILPSEKLIRIQQCIQKIEISSNLLKQNKTNHSDMTYFAFNKVVP